MNREVIIRLSRRSRIPLACTNAVLACSVLLLDDAYNPIRLIALVSFVVFSILVYSRLDNILLFARTLILGGIGYFPMFVKALGGPHAFFSGYEYSTQGFPIVVLMYVGTSLALAGNEIGLYLGSRHRSMHGEHSTVTDVSLWKTIFVISIPIVVWVSVEVVRANGPTVLSVGYAVDHRNLPLGNTINIGIICLLAMLVAVLKCQIKYGCAIIFCLSILLLIYALFLRGLRQDVLTPLLGMAVCYALVRRTTFHLTARGLSIILCICVIFEMWGLARQIIASRGFDLTYVINRVLDNSSGETGAVELGTVSPIATTFSNTVWLIQSRTMNLTWGKSYWEFIPRTPPAFIYPDRPRDYAWMFPDYGLQAGGGFFELAEAYMNFGLAGCLVIPGMISFLLSKAFYNALCKQTVASYFLLFSFLGVFLRGTWYQTFAFYKSFCTAMVLLFLFVFAREMFLGAVAGPKRFRGRDNRACVMT